MTATVEDNALLLEVLAGPDGLDPRQYGHATEDVPCEASAAARAACASAVVEEGFGHPQSQAKVDELVRKAAERLKGLGATVETVSIPMHRAGIGDLAADRGRGRDGADDAGQRLRLQLAGPVRHHRCSTITARGARAPTSCRTR